MAKKAKPKTSSRKKSVAIIMGSQSDWPMMKHVAETLEILKVGYEAKIVSAKPVSLAVSISAVM